MKKTAIVTGASGEIGAAISERLITQGYHVIGTYYSNEEFINELALRLGNNFFPFQCDLSNFDTAKSLFTYIEEKQFQVEVLINNAGISIIGLLQDLTQESWNNIWNTNVTSITVSYTHLKLPTTSRV